MKKYEHILATATIVEPNSIGKPMVVRTPSGKAYRVLSPIYGDARKACKDETNPFLRAHMMEYILALEKTQSLGLPIFYVKTLPEIHDFDLDQAVKVTKPKKKPPPKKIKTYKDTLPSSPNKKVIPSKNLSPEKRDAIKSASLEQILTKSLGARVPFKRRAECKSSARSQKYYISKADLVEVIKTDDRLREKVGNKYASLTKEQICDKIFA